MLGYSTKWNEVSFLAPDIENPERRWEKSSNHLGNKDEKQTNKNSVKEDMSREASFLSMSESMILGSCAVLQKKKQKQKHNIRGINF